MRGLTTSATVSAATPSSSTTSVVRLPVVGDAYLVQPESEVGAVICRYDLDAADVTANPISPVWNDAETVVQAYSLGEVRSAAARILAGMFGPGASLTPVIEWDADAGAPMLVFEMNVPRNLREQRYAFIDQYVRYADIPPFAPVPVLSWVYSDAVSS
jgi:hypothetical protein